ncbi:hypothetical protein UVI_02038550 [Ustilaginoidea virens]|uniref:Uncharacterized protein n=1 Tax=Ustilaginoidea virens TaxID=1159556 RepID=A0A1B5L7Q0_USTVR|nr:hypothetical protein UVI_02038550 [Ustilaginoidea virens]
MADVDGWATSSQKEPRRRKVTEAASTRQSFEETSPMHRDCKGTVGEVVKRFCERNGFLAPEQSQVVVKGFVSFGGGGQLVFESLPCYAPENFQRNETRRNVKAQDDSRFEN